MRGPDLSLRRFQQRTALWLACSFGTLAGACFSPGDGIAPPRDSVYFPVGLALTGPVTEQGVVRDSEYLAVANSDFDLQYNAGTLVVLNLTRARMLIPKPCAADDDCEGGQRCDIVANEQNEARPGFVCVETQGPTEGKPCGVSNEREAAEQLLYPGRCEAIHLTAPPSGETLIQSAVEIGAFATDVVYRPYPQGLAAASDPVSTEPGRLFIPVRGDATLHWADITRDGQIECGQDANRGACDDAHRAGNDPDQENARELRLAAEPFAVDSSADGRVVLVSNQTLGSVSLFETGDDWSRGPELKFQVGNLPARPVGVAAVPPPALSVVGDGAEYFQGFLVTFRNAPEVDLIRYYPDRDSDRRPYATLTNAAGISINSSGVDSRGIAIDSDTRRGLELDCARSANLDPPECVYDAGCFADRGASLSEAARTELSSCLVRAGASPLDVFVTNRAPASLIVGRTTPSVNEFSSTELPSFYDSIALTLGPSRVSVGKVIVGQDANGEPLFERRVFAVCFDSRRIFVYDPDRRRLDTEIVTGRGPHALAIDSRNAHLYVAHFTDSFIGVVSLDRRFTRTYGKMIAMLGVPSPPRASK